MHCEDIRFLAPDTGPDLALARSRVRQRRDGLKVTAALFGATALAGAAIVLGAGLNGSAAQVLPPVVIILIIMPAALLALVSGSSLFWRARLQWLTSNRRRQETLSPFRRKPHGRRRLHFCHSGLLRGRRRLHARLRTPVRRAS